MGDAPDQRAEHSAGDEGRQAGPGTGKEMPGTQQFSHGLGVGDVNGDGKRDIDVICTGGWWEQPAKPDGKTPWKFHPRQPRRRLRRHVRLRHGRRRQDRRAQHLGPPVRHLVAQAAAGRRRTATRRSRRWTCSRSWCRETHAAHFEDIDGDGLKDLVTGKRWWSHGRPNRARTARRSIYWFKTTKGADGMTQFTPMMIDDDSRNRHAVRGRRHQRRRAARHRLVEQEGRPRHRPGAEVTNAPRPRGGSYRGRSRQ